MHIRLLGAHQGESKTARCISILVDGVLAIDAGSLSASLSFTEQRRLAAVLLTHCHYDHIKDILLVGFNMMDTHPIRVYCQPHTRDALETHIMNATIWPRLSRLPRPDAPSIRYGAVTSGDALDIDGYGVLPVALPHTVPMVGYAVARGGKSLFYTGDTRGPCRPAWQQLRPDLLLCEATLPNRRHEDAAAFGHLTPAELEHELADFRALHGYLPRVVALHIDPRHEDEVRADLGAAAATLGAPIEVGYAGMEIDL